MGTANDQSGALGAPTQRPRKRLIFWGIVALAFILLVSFAPGVAVFLAICGFFVGIFALIKGNLRWARIANRKRAFAATGATIVAFFVAGVGLGSTTEANALTVASSDSSVPERPMVGTMDDHLGSSCASEDLYLQQGDLKAFCYAAVSEELVWVASDEHVILVAAAEEEAREERKIAAEEAAESRAAEESRQAAEASQAAEEKRVAEEEARRAAVAAEASRKAEQERVAEEARVEEENRQAQERAEAARAAEAERDAAQKAVTPPETPAGGVTFYKNCDAVRAAGAAPIRVGEPGYARKLDRDGDGVGCE